MADKRKLEDSKTKIREPIKFRVGPPPDNSKDKGPGRFEVGPPPNNSKKYIIAAVALIAIITLATAGYLLSSRSRQTNTYSTDQDIQDTANAISNRLSFISIQKGGIILQGDEEPRAKYTLNINAKYGDEYFFKIYEYWIQTGGNLNEIPTSKICNTINEFFDRKDKILEALRELKIKGSLSFPLWVVNAGVEVDNIQAVIVELLYALRRIYELKTKRVEIMIKGYADGTRGDWNRPLKPDPYYFDHMLVYPPVHPDSLNPVEYFRTETPISIDRNYENRHLPDLRANFVKADLIEPFLKDCKDIKNKEIHILKGYEFSREIIDDSKRMAQVFINIY